MNTTTFSSTSNNQFAKNTLSAARLLLQMLRRRRGLSVPLLALKTGVCPDIISMLEDHRTLPNVDISLQHVKLLVEILADPISLPWGTWGYRQVMTVIYIAAGHVDEAIKQPRLWKRIGHAAAIALLYKKIY